MNMATRRWWHLQFSLRLLFVAMAVAAGPISIGVWYWNAYLESLRPRLISLFGGDEMLANVAAPSSVDVYRLRLPESIDPRYAQITDYAVANGPVRLSERARAKLSRVLVNPRNYRFGLIGGSFAPWVRVRISGQTGSVLLLLDPRGLLARIDENTSHVAGTPMSRHARKEILSVIKEAFPGDRDIQALRN
jgi:hypothetical protein